MPQVLLSVVIPLLGVPPELANTLESLAEADEAGLRKEILLVSGEGGAELRARYGEIATVLSATQGRGQQLAAGAAAAGGKWLLFLHADTKLAPGWATVVRSFLADAANAKRAAVFRLAFDKPSSAARRVARLANWRSRWLGLPYGDQGLLIQREFYEELGGFRPLPLMEDVDLVRRIGRQRLAFLQCEAVTSAERYRRDGWWLRPLRNLSILLLYFLGVPPTSLRRLYG